MGMFGRAISGAKAGSIAAAGVALSFFVLDLIQFQPLATPGVLSGAPSPDRRRCSSPAPPCSYCCWSERRPGLRRGLELAQSNP